MKTLVIGAAIIDIIMKIKRLPKSGEDILCSETVSTVGGCAYNVAGTLRGFDVDHDLFVPVGRGMYGDMIAGDLESWDTVSLSGKRSRTTVTACAWWRRMESAHLSRSRARKGASGPPGLNSCPRMPTTASMWPDTRCAVPAAGSFPIGWRALRTG